MGRIVIKKQFRQLSYNIGKIFSNPKSNAFVEHVFLCWKICDLIEEIVCNGNSEITTLYQIKLQYKLLKIIGPFEQF